MKTWNEFVQEKTKNKALNRLQSKKSVARTNFLKKVPGNMSAKKDQANKIKDRK